MESRYVGATWDTKLAVNESGTPLVLIRRGPFSGDSIAASLDENIADMRYSFNTFARKTHLLGIMRYISSFGPLTGYRKVYETYLWKDSVELRPFMVKDAEKLSFMRAFKRDRPISLSQMKQMCREYSISSTMHASDLPEDTIVEPLSNWVFLKNFIALFSSLQYNLVSGIECPLQHAGFELFSGFFGTYAVAKIFEVSNPYDFEKATRDISVNDGAGRIKRCSNNTFPMVLSDAVEAEFFGARHDHIYSFDVEDSNEPDGLRRTPHGVLSSTIHLASQLFRERGVLGMNPSHNDIGTIDYVMSSIPQVRDYHRRTVSRSFRDNVHLFHGFQPYANRIGVYGYTSKDLLVSISIGDGSNERQAGLEALESLNRKTHSVLAQFDSSVAQSRIEQEALHYGEMPAKAECMAGSLLLFMLGHEGHKLSKCEHCGRITIEPTVGKPRRYCSDSCRKYAGDITRAGTHLR